MPPKVVKRGGAARRGGRLTRSALKAQNPPVKSAHEESDIIFEMSGSDAVEAKEETPEVDESIEEDYPLDGRKQSDLFDDSDDAANLDAVFLSKKENEVKDSVDDFRKDERLDLDDNEPEFEAEDYGGEDFEERDLEQEDHELVNQEEEELEEEIEVEDEEGEFADEIGDEPEELESEDNNEHADGDVKHGETVDMEEEVHHDVLYERRKRKEFEIFVGSLEKGATEEDLKKAFGHVGEVTEIRILKNPQSKKSKGSAFLRFATVEQAKRAVKELKNIMINGKKCGVTASQDNDTLLIGNICKTWTPEDLREKLKHFGVENMDDITLVEDINNVNMNRGYAFLEFTSRSDAMDAHKRLLKKDVMFGVEKPAKVSFADSFLDSEDEIMAQVMTIFIDGLSPSWNEEHVRDLLKSYGKLEKIELARNMPSARRKDFGFVTFDTHEAAMICAKSINNSDLVAGEKKAKVRARLSRPHGAKSRLSSRSDHRSRHGAGRSGRSLFARLPPRSVASSRSARSVGSRAPPSSTKRAAGSRGRRPRPPLPPPARSRPLPPARPLRPPARSYDRRPPVPLYPKASLKRDHGRHDDHPPLRSRPAVSYSSRLSPERHLSYGDDYAPRGSGYPDLPRNSSCSEVRRPFVDDLYSLRFERPPSYSEGRSRVYEPLPGSKRPYASLDNIPPRYADVDVRHSRPRLDYELAPSQYGESYGDRLDRIPRSSLGYRSSRNSMAIHDSRGPYSSRQGMDYGGGSYSGSDVGGMYSSSYDGDLPTRDGLQGGGCSYSSMYSSRSSAGGNYSGGGPGSYY